MNIVHSIAIIVVVAIVTFLIRACPFLLFGGKKEVPKVITYLGHVLPAAIMTTLVVYCLRNIKLLTGNHGIPQSMGSQRVVYDLATEQKKQRFIVSNFFER